MGTGDCTTGDGDAIVDLAGEIIPGVGDVNCDPLLVVMEFTPGEEIFLGVGDVNCDPLFVVMEFMPGEDIFLGVGEARMLMAGDDTFLCACGFIAGAGLPLMLFGAGLPDLEFGLI